MMSLNCEKELDTNRIGVLLRFIAFAVSTKAKSYYKVGTRLGPCSTIAI